jgi:hypothetical protein
MENLGAAPAHKTPPQPLPLDVMDAADEQLARLWARKTQQQPARRPQAAPRYGYLPGVLTGIPLRADGGK